MMEPIPILGELFTFLFTTAFWIQTATVMGLSLLVAYALRPKPPGGGGGTLDDIQVPTCAPGRPLPVIFGTVRLNSPNWLWWGDLVIHEKERHDTPIAYIYLGKCHLGLCHAGIDGIKQIWYGHKVAWPTAEDETDFAADAAATADVDARFLYGSYYDGGKLGLVGTFAIEYGPSDQAQNADLAALLGADIPNFRGMVGLVGVSRDAGANDRVEFGCSQYFENIGCVLKATDKLTDGSAQWYAAKSAIGTYDLNPAHIIRQCLTDTLWGERVPTADIGDSFTTAADTLYTESLGLSFAYAPEPGNLQDFVDMVLRHIDGVLYLDHVTGKLEIALARDDYSAADLTEYDQSDFEILEFKRASYGDVSGRVLVKWTNRLHPEVDPTPAAYDDIAVQAKQGRIVEEVIDFPGVCTAALANTLAGREGRQRASMPATLTLRAKRTMADLHPGGVIKLSYSDADLNITQMIVRLGPISYGRLDAGAMTIEAAEDVFGTAYTIYGDPPETEWPNPTPSLSSSEWPSASPTASPSSSSSHSISSSPSTSPSASPSSSPS